MTATNQPLTNMFGNNIPVNYTYDSYNFPTGLTVGSSPFLYELGYSFNHNTGNLNSRTNVTHSNSETFTYDNLNRLNIYTTNMQLADTVNYEQNGNISDKTDAGTYTYDQAKKHAVTLILPSDSCAAPLRGQIVTYTPFNKILHITEGNKDLELFYGPNHARKVTKYYEDSVLLTTTYFLGSYEEETTGGDTRKTHYISGNDGLDAVVIRQNNVDSIYYVVKDHLGSINALINQSGNIVEEYSFDAYGRRRNATDWTYYNITAPTLLKRGYTGHEHLDSFNLINMNGRVYDPIIGRMLSPDIYTSANSTQGLNLYTYCNNNPLKYTDPSGFYSQLMDMSYFQNNNIWSGSGWVDPSHLYSMFNGYSQEYGRGEYSAYGPGIGNNLLWSTGGGKGYLSTVSNSGMIVSTNSKINGYNPRSVYSNFSKWMISLSIPLKNLDPVQIDSYMEKIFGSVRLKNAGNPPFKIDQTLNGFGSSPPPNGVFPVLPGTVATISFSLEALSEAWKFYLTGDHELIHATDMFSGAWYDKYNEIDAKLKNGTYTWNKDENFKEIMGLWSETRAYEMGNAVVQKEFGFGFNWILKSAYKRTYLWPYKSLVY